MMARLVAFCPGMEGRFVPYEALDDKTVVEALEATLYEYGCPSQKDEEEKKGG